MDFSPIADTFRGPVPQNDVGSTGAADTAKSICPCYACSPRSFDGDAELIRHGVDSDGWICGEGTPATSTPGAPAASTSTTTDATSSTTAASQPGNNAPPPSQPRKNAPPSTPRYNPPHTRAYIHHLLHTHEMSAHALLVSHNLAVVEAFLRGIRGVLLNPSPSTSAASSDTDASASADFESITIETPGLLTTTSRGVVPHIAWDTYERHAEMGPLKWVNVPWESFLEHNPPVPTLFASSASATKDTNETKKPFHQFLGFKPRNHILSLSARDADDTKEMPPNGNDVVSVSTLRGVRKLTPTSYSQKRLTKSIERSGAWIGTLLGLAPPSSGSGSASDSARGKKKKGPKQAKGTKGTEGEERRGEEKRREGEGADGWGMKVA